MRTPILDTERLILRPLQRQDAKAVYTGWGSDERVVKFMRWSIHKSLKETLEWLAEDVKKNETDSYYNWGIVRKHDGSLIGCVGFFADKEEGFYEIGYNIRHDCWNHGYTTEAAKRVLQYGARELGIRGFLSCHAIENPASGKVLEKCGFIYTNDFEYSKFDGSGVFKARKYRLI